MWARASTAKIDAAARLRGGDRPRGCHARRLRSSACYELERQTGRVFVHPFDDPVVIAGAGTVGLEILEDVPDVDTIVVSVGGGGLVSGIAAVCAPAGVRVVAVEPERSTALQLGARRRTAGAGDPRHDRGRPRRRRSQALSRSSCCTALGVEVVLVTEDEIREAFRFLYERAKLAVEPALRPPSRLSWAGMVEGGTVVTVVSGGNVSADTASAILAGR